MRVFVAGASGAIGRPLIPKLVAVGRESWRVPVLALALIQYALHSLNHLIDIGEADPGWIGPADFVSLALTTLLLAWMLKRETAQ